MTRPRIAIVHIGKTGGNTLIEALARHYPKDERAPHIMGPKRPEPESLGSYRLIAGHFGFDYAVRTGAELVTVLREPVDRIVSLYHFWQQLPEREMVRKMTLSEFAQSDHHSILIDFANAQTWQIASEHTLERRKALRGISGEELLDLAKKNLEKFRVVGVTENMPRLARELRNAFGFDVNLGMKRNKTASRVHVDDITASERALIEVKTSLDRQLYEYVLSLYDI